MNAVTFSAVVVTDERKASRRARNRLVLSAEAVDVALAVTGVEMDANTKITVRVRDGVGKQGQAQQVAPGKFVVDIYVASKPNYADRHLYPINNSLLHELRHVAQMQRTPGFAKAYTAATKKVGYTSNAFEVEARFYGRLADATGTKDTGPAGPAVGEDAWAIRFAH